MFRMRFMRYLVVGTIAFAVDLGCLMALVNQVPLLIANTIAFLLANLVNFVLAHVWVFRRPLQRRDLVRAYVAVLAISLVGLALNDALVWLGVRVADVGIVTSKVAATIAVLCWNYFSRAFWVYRGSNA